MTDSPVLIGGSPTSAAVTTASAQYRFGEEDGDIYTNTLNIDTRSASGGSDPNIIVGDVHAQGSGELDPHVSHVNVTTGGDVLFEGQMDFANVAAGDSLTINANAIEVNTDTGGISMTASDGKLAGTLTLNASTSG